MTNVGKNNAVPPKAAPVPCQVIFHQNEPAFSPATPTDDAAGTAGRCRSRIPSSHQYLHPPNIYNNVHKGKQIKFKPHTSKQTVLERNMNFPPIVKVTPRRWPVLARATPTRITPSRATTCLQYWTTTQNLRKKATN